MVSLYAIVCYVAVGVVLISWDAVSGDVDLSDIFGSNIDKEGAWEKLFELENCPMPQQWTDTIIMVNESLAAGAKFMDSPNVTSRYECEFECCDKQTEGCNIAVYTPTQKRCYLFNCGRPSKCKFDQHADYTVSSLAEEVLSDTKGAALPATESTTKLAITTQAPPKELNLLDGCRAAIDKCVTSNTECSSKGFCMCKSGYHPKNGVCRKDCIEGLQFECTNGDSKYGRPDCIAIYDVCDGTPQCPDGSDETGCDSKDAIDWSKLNSMPSLKSKIQEYLKNAAASSERTTEASSAVSTAAEVKAILAGKVTVDSHESQLAGLTTTTPAVPPPAAVSQPTDGTQATAGPKLTDSSGSTSPIVLEEGGFGNDSSSLTENEAVLDAEEGKGASGSRSAVIALSLTLVLTSILIVFLGCRYRSMRRRMVRPGKALNVGEVDYLIDGMYL